MFLWQSRCRHLKGRALLLQVTTAERTDATQVVGRNATLSSIAFGGRLPDVLERQQQSTVCAAGNAVGNVVKHSVLEQELQLVSAVTCASNLWPPETSRDAGLQCVCKAVSGGKICRACT